MKRMICNRGYASLLLLAFFFSIHGLANSATVIYQFEEETTSAILGYLEFSQPPASPSSGWSLGSDQESAVVSFIFNAEPIDLSELNITRSITSATGANLDEGILLIGQSPPKWVLNFSSPGMDIIEIPGGARAMTYRGDWTVVPVPPAVWLFGSGIVGLIGVARRKRAA